MSESLTVSLSHQILFSCGLRFNQPQWDEATNVQFYGKYARPHGCNFRLVVALSGPVASDDGMIVNLVSVKPYLKQIVNALDNRFLNEDVAYFRQHNPTAENIAAYLWDQMPSHIGNGALYRLLLHQDNRAIVQVTLKTMKVSRSYEFAAAHRLFTPNLSVEENWEKFDKCSNPAGHGHNFQLTVWIEGKPDEQSGFIINPSLLDSIVEREIYKRFDHKHLNEDCPEFRDSGLVPTTENLALVIFKILQPQLAKHQHVLAKVGIQETQKNYFEVEA